MTSIALRRLTFKVGGLRIHPLAVAAALFIVLAALLILLLPVRGPVGAATISLPPAKARALIQATSGEASIAMRATGDQAKLINAALPFAGGPLLSARPFEVSGSDTDQRRALLCLTQAVYYEAGFEPLEGRRAVAQVILNRMRHPAFPKSVCGVVYQRNSTPICQFTFVCDGSLYRRPSATMWNQAEQVARSALAGYVEASVGAATHYHADYVAPRWAPLLAKVARLGQHIFYRWPGAWGRPAAFTGRYIGEPSDPLAMRPVPTIASIATDPVVQAAIAGPPVPRAENDVGGLLDTTKGWTLSIPGPDDTATAKLVADQQSRAVAAAVNVGPAVASR